MNRFAISYFCIFAAVLAVPDDTAAASDRFSGLRAVSSSVYDALDSLWPEELAVPGLSAQLGAGVGFSPEYNGSDSYDVRLVPILRLQYKDYLTLTGTTLRAYVHHGDSVRAGVVMRYATGRSSDKHPALVGLGGVSDTLALGPFVEYRRDPFRLRLDLRHGLGAGYGTKVQATGVMGLLETEKLGVQSAISTTWVSSKHMQTYFGITAEQAANSLVGLPAYTAKSGFSEAAWSVSARYRLTNRLSAVGFVEYARLLGNAKGSPLVDVGSANQFSGGTGLMFNF